MTSTSSSQPAISKKEYIQKRVFPRGWVSNAQVYNPFNPYIRVISYSSPIDYPKLLDELSYFPGDRLPTLPRIIFKNSRSRAFHIKQKTARQYLSLCVANIDRSVHLQTHGSKVFSSLPTFHELVTRRYHNLYGALKLHSTVYYFYAGRIVYLIDSLDKLTSLELISQIEEAQTLLKSMGVTL